MKINPAALTVGGFPCPVSGEIAGRTIPWDNQFYLTSFGGGSDTQPMACGGPIADASWFYMADSWRWPCGSRVLITNPDNGRGVVAQVADVGPNVCVESAAGKPVIDASPLVAQALFGARSAGYSDHFLVTAQLVDPATPLGVTTGDRFALLKPRLVLAGLLGLAAWAGYEAWRLGQFAIIGLHAPSAVRANPSRRRRRSRGA